MFGWPKYPHGHGFVAAISINEQGYESAIFALEIVIISSSIGWRRVSIVARENSDNSSKNSTPLCASEISPGWGMLPPPERPAEEIVWCGALNGLCVTSGELFCKIPAME